VAVRGTRLAATVWLSAAVSLQAGAIAWADPSAPQDDGRAAFERGLAADLGQGQPADPVLAIHYYRISAEQGDPDAELNLAVMTDSGVGTRADPAAAMVWYGRAAAHGIGRAAFDLGQLYADGIGVPRNHALAAAWFGRAASQGIVVAAERQRMMLRSRDEDAPDLAAPRPLAPVADVTLNRPEVEFVWQPMGATPREDYWVQVVPLDEPGRTVVYEKTDVSSLLVGLPASGRYAWRVFAADAPLGQYQASGWSAFSVVRHDECCLAALTNR
jgi:hypothetical protein